MSDKPDMAEIEKFDKSDSRKQKRKRKIHCLQKKRLNRRSKQASCNEVCAASMHCTFRKHCLLILVLLAVNFVRRKQVGSSLKMTVLPFFTSNNGELLTRYAHSCLSHLPVWLAGKEKNLHIGERGSWVGQQ